MYFQNPPDGERIFIYLQEILAEASKTRPYTQLCCQIPEGFEFLAV